MKTKILKRIFIVMSLSILFMTGTISFIYISTRDNIFSDIEKIPYSRVGLIPGCNKYIANGVVNDYYIQRIEAGTKLFNAGKIDYILVSGDNAHASYDEPREMKHSLIEAGIPKENIYSDYAGFRTLDTIVRAKEVFQLEKVTFISQNFQNQRGVFIGINRELKIVAYNADAKDLKSDFKIVIREILAKFKMLADLYIISKEPKFLGDKITIGESD